MLVTETQRGSLEMSAAYCAFHDSDLGATTIFPFGRLIANITRLFFWLGNRFELALLVQSILMILAQV